MTRPGQHEQQRFTLMDHWGKEHHYVVPVIPAMRALSLVPRIAGPAADPVARMLGKVLQGVFAQAGSEELAVLVSQFEGGADEGWSATLMKAGYLEDRREAHIIRELLQDAVRDKQPLDTDVAFNAAYDRNLDEAYQACLRVVLGNGLLPGAITSIVETLAQLPERLQAMSNDALSALSPSKSDASDGADLGGSGVSSPSTDPLKSFEDGPAETFSMPT